MTNVIRLLAALACAVTVVAEPAADHVAAQSRSGDPADFEVLDLSGRPGPPGPALPAPAGATIATSGRESSSISNESSVTLDTALGLAAVATHYSKHIAGAKWRLEGRSADADALIVERFSGATRAGAPVTALLTVTRLTPSRLDVALRFVRQQPALIGRPGGPPVPAGRPGGAGASALGGTPPMRRGGETPSAAVPARGPFNPADVVQQLLQLLPLTNGPEKAVIQSALPTGFPKELLPSGAKVEVVAVASTLVTVVASAPKFEMATVTKHLRSLVSTGWQDSGIIFGGFMNEGLFTPEICRGSEIARFRFTRREAGGAFIRLSVSNPDPCSVPARPFADVALPMLFHPPRAVVSGTASRSGPDSYLTQVRLPAPLGVPGTSAYYIDLMIKSGWPLQGRVESEGLSVSRHRSATTSGDPLTAILAIVQTPGDAGSADGWLRVVRHVPTVR